MKRTAEIGDRADLAGWGPAEVVEIVVGDYRRPEKRYVRALTASGVRVLVAESAWLKLSREGR